MSDTQTLDQSQGGRSHAYHRLTPESAVLVLIDHQAGLVAGRRDLAPDEVRHNVVAFARAARVLGVPSAGDEAIDPLCPILGKRAQPTLHNRVGGFSSRSRPLSSWGHKLLDTLQNRVYAILHVSGLLDTGFAHAYPHRYGNALYPRHRS